MRVHKISDSISTTVPLPSRWAVADDLGNWLAGPFETSVEAWRWADYASGEPLSPAQKRADYGWNKFVSGT